MDYFGLVSESDPSSSFIIDSPQETQELKDNQETHVFIDVSTPKKCASPECPNNGSSYGTFCLPYCDRNPICAKRNVEHLFLENAILKGEISAMEFIISQYYESFIKSK